MSHDKLCPKPPTPFVREATGLVRGFSLFDAFMISVGSILIGPFVMSFIPSLLSSAYPGADPRLGLVFGVLFSLPLAVVYGLIARAVPRTGGDYIWVSRFIRPEIGVLAAWGFWIGMLSIVAIDAYLFGVVVMPTFLAAFGYGLNAPSLITLATSITSPMDVFVIAMLSAIVSLLMTMFGPKVWAKTMTAMFAVIILSWFAWNIILLSSSHTDFVNAIYHYGGSNVTYDGLLNQATSVGWNYVPLTLSMTIVGIPITFLNFIGNNFPAAAGGEIRDVKMNAVGGILLGLFFAFFMNWLGVTIALNVIDYKFFQATNFLGAAWPLAGSPWLVFLVSTLTHNILLLTLLMLGWFLALIWNNAAILLACNRYVFALSFDRVFPTTFAKVNDKFHSPVNATILTSVVTAILVALATFTTWIGLYLNSIAILAVVFALGSAAGIVLPYKRKDLVASLPGAKWPVPLLTMLGSISFILTLMVAYFSVTNPNFGPTSPQALLVLVVIIVTGLIIYGASYAYNKSRGIDLKMIYQEVPPE